MSCDLILRGGEVLDVESGTLKRADLCISDGLVQFLTERGESLTAERIVDVSGRVLAPGFMDAHLHIESSMLTPAEFARAAASCGTTAAFVDPHEIANVAGVDGVEFFLEQADKLPLDLFVGIPSCVPATHLENAGGAIGLADIDRLLEQPRVCGLAEMMNFPGIVHGLGDARARVNMACEAGKIVDGHAPGLSGDDLQTYITNGENDGIARIMSDHECTNLEEALEKHNAGMTIALRCGTASKDIDRILPPLWEAVNGDLRGFMLCSDDVSAAELADNGHVDRIIRQAQSILVNAVGLDPQSAAIEAIRMATSNVGAYFARFLETEGYPPYGTLNPGARANVAIIDSLETLNVVGTVHGGQIHDSESTSPAQSVPAALRSSVQLKHGLGARDFELPVKGDSELVTVRVIDCEGGSLLTGEAAAEFTPAHGVVFPDPERDLAVIAVFERHGGPGTHCTGLVRGLGLKRGAIASTVAHDSHNLVAAGVDTGDLVSACDALQKCGGGLAVCVAGETTLLPLPIGGLMSDQPINTVVREFRALLDAARQTGTPMDNPFMALSFLSLPVIPNLKITDRGLVDVNQFDFVPFQLS